MNTTDVSTRVLDYSGAIVYTVVVLVFYSLSLILSLSMNLISSENLAERKRDNYVHGQKDHFLRNKRDILDQLSNVDLRMRYWKIYYGEMNDQIVSRRFSTNETKLLSRITKRKQELNLKRMKINDDLQYLNHGEPNRIFIRNPRKPIAKFPWELKRSRSNSMPGIFQPRPRIYKKSLTDSAEDIGFQKN